MKRKFLSIFLSFVLLFGAAIPAYAAEETEQEASSALSETIFICSTEDFLAFAEKCSLDTWSLDKKVILQTDISLSGTNFSGIATFGGILEGNGHTISDLLMEGSVAPAGLFRYLQPTAVVQNLNVTGQITPDGDADTLGGIAGENQGTIEKCSFSGVITGSIDTGGIAGSNFGIIRECKASGKLIGENRTGGVAGYNQGTIDRCESSMEINVDSVDPTIDPTAIDLDFNMDLSRLSSINASDAAKDTGGIAGYSSGIVIDCSNTGKVGYPHIGYNLGGIVGRNCGFVGNCRNTGHIQGRKDVGGIAGQIEPNIATVLSPDYLATLSKQFDNLGNLVSTAGSHAAGTGGAVQSCIQTIGAYQNSARAALDSIVSGLGNGLDGDPGTKIDISGVQSLRNAVHGMVGATSSLRNAIGGGIEGLSEDVDAISGQIGSIARTFSLATQDARQDTVTDISDVDLEDISEGKLLQCTNDGVVEGDLNIGGVVGVMGLEYEIDPEDDAPGGSATQRRRYELKAIVQECVNNGIVNSKRSYAGGICGRMELGLIYASQGYGAIASENGDYVGGIAGLAGGTVRECFAKCTLSGRSYIGGIVGCGIAEDFSGESSTVTGCYSMVNITDSEQYTGSISGANIGNYTGNFFVSDTLAGINGISYSALAEPISYDALWRTQGLPKKMREFTLSFIADGETIQEIPFDYGDSFDFSVYPEIPQRDGYYAQWSTNDLSDLRFDTQVEVEYYPHITALNSTSTRPDGRSVLFVQGKFKNGDTIQVTPGTTAFPEDADRHLLECWHISIPADGLECHNIRYLPTGEHPSVYLLENGNWNKLSPEITGSYLAFEASGAEVEIAVVSESVNRLHWLIAPAAILLLIAIVLFALKKKPTSKAKPEQSDTPTQPESSKPKKKKRWLLLAAALCLLCMAASMYSLLSQTKVGQSIQAYDILQTWLEQPEQEMQLAVKAQIDEKDVNLTAQVSRLTVGNTTVSVISESGRKLYFAEDVVFLENGDAYHLNSAAPDYSNLPELVLACCKLAEFDDTGGIYSVTAEDEQATAMLKLLLPSAESLLPEANRLTINLIAEAGALSQIRFTGAGNLTDSVKTPFSLSATVDVLPVSGSTTVPKAVQEKILSGDYHPQEIYSDEFVKLMDAWSHIRVRNPLAAQIVLEADCGPLMINDTFDYYQWKADSSVIQGVERDGKLVFFNDLGSCDSGGRKSSSVSITENTAELLDIAYGSFSKADFQFRQEDTANIYLVSLDSAGMETIANTLLPQTEEMNITFEKGSIQLIVEDGEIQTVSITCSGSTKALAASIDYRMKADVRFTNGEPEQELPEAVKEALLK